ncbi:MAG: class IV adenylate cyclase, partial [Thermoprotei archaeon]
EYELGGVKVSLDVVEGLGSFVEVEAVGDDVEAAAARVREAAAMLGLDFRKALTATYLELLARAQQS